MCHPREWSDKMVVAINYISQQPGEQFTNELRHIVSSVFIKSKRFEEGNALNLC